MSPKLRFSILRRDNFVCQYCGVRAPEVRLEVDHIVARARGGRDDEWNLITACEPCNRGKRASPMLPRWQQGYHYAAAGMAIETLYERFTSEVTSHAVWEILQTCLSSEEPEVGVWLMRTAPSFFAVQALIDEVYG